MRAARPRRRSAVWFVAALSLVAGCPSPRKPTPTVGSLVLEIGRDGGSLRGVAADGSTTFAAVASFGVQPKSVIEARRGKAIAWSTPLAGGPGPIALGSGLLGITLSGAGTVAGLELRGEPGVVVAALDAASGAVKWKLAIDSSEWAVPSSIAAIGGGFVVGGTFSGTLRAADKIVSSAGKLDGFVARLSATGQVEWLIRVGGPHADAVLGVATDGQRIAITGTFATGAELQGEPLLAADDKAPTVDVFVAELDGKGARKWAQSFGGKLDDSVAGIAIDGRGRLAVAATLRDMLKIDVHDITARGGSDGVVVFFDKAGSPGPVVNLGGSDKDSLSAIAASGDKLIVSGLFAGPLQLGRETLNASGDDAYLVALDGVQIAQVWPIKGAGREDITALSSIPGGFVAGLAHSTSATIDGQTLASPKDPTSGFGLVVEPVR
jgi:hypothetical protein